ncbi:hypothetical protein PoB_006059000 [Plakobranchus ocellatus]|uniref:Uncharacterized protein n=1 Tax=Plakobranchus ocellatus TaxID=259542 RepID=A0AAV4CQH1_9GAST|nr:hypothetical protein PoB_006059000 [Plakobranchus ocellatus]
MRETQVNRLTPSRKINVGLRDRRSRTSDERGHMLQDLSVPAVRLENPYLKVQTVQVKSRRWTSPVSCVETETAAEHDGEEREAKPSAYASKFFNNTFLDMIVDKTNWYPSQWIEQMEEYHPQKQGSSNSFLYMIVDETNRYPSQWIEQMEEYHSQKQGSSNSFLYMIVDETNRYPSQWIEQMEEYHPQQQGSSNTFLYMIVDETNRYPDSNRDSSCSDDSFADVSETSMINNELDPPECNRSFEMIPGNEDIFFGNSTTVCNDHAEKSYADTVPVAVLLTLPVNGKMSFSICTDQISTFDFGPDHRTENLTSCSVVTKGQCFSNEPSTPTDLSTPKDLSHYQRSRFG